MNLARPCVSSWNARAQHFRVFPKSYGSSTKSYTAEIRGGTVEYVGCKYKKRQLGADGSAREREEKSRRGEHILIKSRAIFQSSSQLVLLLCPIIKTKMYFWACTKYVPKVNSNSSTDNQKVKWRHCRRRRRGTCQTAVSLISDLFGGNGHLPKKKTKTFFLTPTPNLHFFSQLSSRPN